MCVFGHTLALWRVELCISELTHFALVSPPEHGVSGNRRPGGVWLDYPESASASVQDLFGELGDTRAVPACWSKISARNLNFLGWLQRVSRGSRLGASAYRTRAHAYCDVSCLCAALWVASSRVPFRGDAFWVLGIETHQWGVRSLNFSADEFRVW